MAHKGGHAIVWRNVHLEAVPRSQVGPHSSPGMHLDFKAFGINRDYITVFDEANRASDLDGGD